MSKHFRGSGIDGVYLPKESLIKHKHDEKSLSKPQPETPSGNSEVQSEKSPPRQLSPEEKYKLMLYLT